MSSFMLLLHETPMDPSAFSAEEMQAVIAEYTAWREQLIANQQLAGGEKLTDEGGRNLRMVDGRLQVTDGPYSEAKEVLGGYFTITADSYDEAIAIAESCPHLKFGGRIELREVDAIH